jgi:two-component system, NtrC family, sensor kinase
LRTLRRRELWAEISEAQQVDARGKVVGTIRVHTDVTDRHRTEMALRESEARYRLLAEYATDMISRHTPDGRFLYASPAARSLAGYGPEELIGTTPAELVHPEDLPTLNRLRSTSLTSKMPTTFTYRLRRKDGSYIWVETTWRPIRESASETVTELVAVSRDITERKRAESAMDDVGTKRS